jgi:hypothetical protein
MPAISGCAAKQPVNWNREMRVNCRTSAGSARKALTIVNGR